MASHSLWSSLPDEPQTSLGWSLLGFLEEGPRVLVNTSLSLAFVSLFAAVASVGAGGDLSGGAWSFPIRRRRAPRPLSGLSPIPCPDLWYPIHVEIRQKGVRTGFDQGMAVFYDGWLHVEGRRTAFSVRSSDALATEHGEGARLWMADGLLVEIAPYDRIADRKGLAEAFGAAFERWRRASVPQGHPLYPPRSVHPWARGRAVAAILHGTGLIALSGLAAVFASPVAWWLGGLVALCGLWRLGRGAMDLDRLRALAEPPYSSSP